MSRDELTTLLNELVEDVDRPDLAARAWLRARRVRRRRTAVAIALAVLLIVAGPVALSRRTPSAPGPASSGPRIAVPRVDVLPARLESEPATSSIWPAQLDPPRNGPGVGSGAFSHAVLVYQPDGKGTIFGYGERSNGTFGWFDLGVDALVTDRASALDAGSLGPMGQQIALAQPDAYVFVDLLTHTTQRVPVPGPHDDVAWLPDGAHLFLSGAAGTTLLQVPERGLPATVIGPVAVPGADIATLVGNGTGLATMTRSPTGLLVVTQYDDEGRSPKTESVFSPAGLRVDTLAPRGWRSGNLIAQAASGRIGDRPADFILILDAENGRLTHLLDLGAVAATGCCSVLGWMNTDEVIVRTANDIVLWHLADGRVTRLATNAPGPLSVAPAGCDWRITIAGVTAACIT